VARVGSPKSEPTARAAQQALRWSSERSSAASCWVDLPRAGGGHAIVVLRRPERSPFSVRDRETLGMAHEALLWLVRETAEDRLHAVASRKPVHLPSHMTTGGIPTNAGDVRQAEIGFGKPGHSATAKPFVRVADFAQSNTPSRGGADAAKPDRAHRHGRASHRPGEGDSSSKASRSHTDIGGGDHHNAMLRGSQNMDDVGHCDFGARTRHEHPGDRSATRPTTGSVGHVGEPRNSQTKTGLRVGRLSFGNDHPLTRDLTRQQRAVLPLLLEGQPEADIAKTMHRSVHTIHDHAKAIYAKLGVSTRAQLVARFMMTGPTGTQG